MFNKPEPDGRASTYYALPLLDMANHDNACPHYNVFRPCEFDSSRECVYLMAGADVAAGQEVCFFYGYMLPDRALLEYGFLQQQPQLQGAPQLFGIDRHDADFDTEPLAKLVAQPEPFVGECSSLAHCSGCSSQAGVHSHWARSGVGRRRHGSVVMLQKEPSPLAKDFLAVLFCECRG